MTYKLLELADVIRSKNSGPYELTFDIIFKDREKYNQVCESNIFTKESFGQLYDITPDSVMEIVHFDPAKAIKITIVRPISSGALGETDVYGAQQHAPLMGYSFEMD